MRLTGSTVSRGLVLLEPDESDVPVMVRVDATIALARCEQCGTRCRVLPGDVLPCKTYGLAVIEHEVSAYSRGDRSLRQVAWPQLGDPTPAHTTLHGWTEGLGAHALGRPGGETGGAPMSQLLAEAEPRVPGIAEAKRNDPTPRNAFWHYISRFGSLQQNAPPSICNDLRAADAAKPGRNCSSWV